MNLASPHASPPPPLSLPIGLLLGRVQVLVEPVVQAPQVLVLEHLGVAGEAPAQRRRGLDTRLDVSVGVRPLGLVAVPHRRAERVLPPAVLHVVLDDLTVNDSHGGVDELVDGSSEEVPHGSPAFRTVCF